MRELTEASVATRATDGGWEYPYSVDTVCPHCRKQVNLRTELNKAVVAQRRVADSRCPACHGTVAFLAVCGPEPASWSGELFIHPSFEEREPLPVAQIEEFTPNLADTYESAVRLIGLGEWRAATALCRTVLEGVTEKLLPAECRRDALAVRLSKLPEHVDLGGPISEIGDLLRKGGNAAAHFDDAKVVNEETARELIDLTDYLIEYLLLLPHRLRELRDQIEASPEA